MKTRTKVIGGIGMLAVLAAFTIRGVMGSSSQADKGKAAVVPVAVEVSTVTSSTLTETISAVGTVSAMKDVTVASETAGRVMKVYVKTGDYVKQGQTLVLVDDELKAVAVQQAKAQALAAETNATKARRDVERAESLYKTKDISDAELDGYRLGYRSAEAQYQGAIAALKAAQRQLDDTRIKAPIAGFVASTRVELGEMVGPGNEVANIVDLSSVKVKLSVAEDDIAKLRPKQVGTLRLDSAPHESFSGVVYSIGSKAESPNGHTYPVELLVQNRNSNVLKAGMFARVDIKANTVKNALTISKESLVNDDANPIVFVVEGTVAKARPVKLGIRAGSSVQVVEGLREGDLVISFGQKKLKDGAPIQYKQ